AILGGAVLVRKPVAQVLTQRTRRGGKRQLVPQHPLITLVGIGEVRPDPEDISVDAVETLTAVGRAIRLSDGEQKAPFHRQAYASTWPGSHPPRAPRAASHLLQIPHCHVASS